MNLVLDGARPPGVSVRQHLADQLRAALLDGQIVAGESLPSSRVLAATVGVSRGTAVAVYEELAGEGYLVIRPGSGTFAAEDLAGRTAAPALPLPSSPASSSVSHEDHGSDVRGSGMRGAEPRDPRPLVDLWPGSPSPRFHRNRDWVAAWRSALADEPAARPPSPAGHERTRALIAEHLASARGIRCSAEEVLITAGTSDGIGLVVHALRGRGMASPRIATEDPGYPAARRAIERIGGEAVPIPVREGGMDLEALEADRGSFAAAMLTPSHQYPLGGRLPVAARLALLDWAERRRAILVEDDYDSEFRHGAPALPAIASLDPAGRVVHVGSYSKTLTPWLRCGYLVVPDPELRAELLSVRADLGQPVSGVMQLALAEFLRSGGLRRHLVRMGREYAHRRGLVMRATEHLAPRVRLDAVEGGLHAVLSWNAGPTAERAVARLEERSIRVAPLPEYYHPGSPRVRQGIVLGYGAPTDTQLHAALAAIGEVLGGAG